MDGAKASHMHPIEILHLQNEFTMHMISPNIDNIFEKKHNNAHRSFHL